MSIDNPRDPSTAGLTSLLVGSVIALICPLCLAAQLPTAYGWYVEVGTTHTEVPMDEVKTVPGLVLRAKPTSGYALDGLSGTPSTTLAPGTLQFIVYEQGLKVADVHLARLEYLVNVRAGSLDDTGMREDMFQLMYGRKRSDLVPVNMWRPIEDIPLRVEPVVERPDMFRLTTTHSLRPGRYAVYLAGTLHSLQSYFAFNTGIPTGRGARWFALTDPETAGVRTPLDSLVEAFPENREYEVVTRAYPTRALPVWMALQNALAARKSAVTGSDNKSMVIVAEGTHGGLFKHYDKLFIWMEPVSEELTRVHVKLLRYTRDPETNQFTRPGAGDLAAKDTRDFLDAITDAIGS